jgi:citrate lyase subunit beta/citryl-CoA lyase
VTAPPLARSYLYVPGDRADRLAGAGGRGADALIADLEDAVAPDAKAAARDTVRAWLDDLGTRPAAQTWVRVNADAVGADLDAVTTPALTGVVVAKGEVARIREVGALLDRLEARRGIAPGTVRLIPLIESAVGLQEVAEIARLPRLHRIGLGEVDLAAELGLALDEPRDAFTALRLQVVVASAAAGIGRPVGPTSTAFRDLDGFRETGQTLRRLGFRARTAMHPAQIPVIHDVFTPTAEELAHARDLLARFEAAQGGPILDDNGRFVDLAVIRNAREVAATAH